MVKPACFFPVQKRSVKPNCGLKAKWSDPLDNISNAHKAQREHDIDGDSMLKASCFLEMGFKEKFRRTN